ncbi:MAG TPA: hypothetical protein VL003_11710, partial [Pusillimonas sp.]|uniref:hypothetical protein n=1 Tax=Pusillimonas sp. TaxID=3040095 RepID=UPI002CFD052D
MNKAALSIATVLLLAGCATSEQGLGLHQLETDSYRRDVRTLPMDFVQIQRAVFKQQARCDSRLEFKVDEMHPSYARVTQPLSEGAQAGEWNKMMVLGLTLTQHAPAKVLGVTLREGGEASTKAQLYSYYALDKAKVTALYNALLHPDLCPGETPPEETD